MARGRANRSVTEVIEERQRQMPVSFEESPMFGHPSLLADMHDLVEESQVPLSAERHESPGRPPKKKNTQGLRLMRNMPQQTPPKPKPPSRWKPKKPPAPTEEEEEVPSEEEDEDW
jgi:hypothetical protein